MAASAPSLAADLTWGAQEVEIQSAAGCFRFEGLSPSQADALRGRYGRQIWSQTHLQADVVCAGGRLPSSPDVPPGALSVHGQYAPQMRRGPDSLAITGVNFVADVHWGRPTSARLSVAREEELAQPIVVENFLRVLSGYLVLDRGGILLHSAGIVLSGAAYLFVGRSGAGKTTLTRKAHGTGAKVLSDDINVLLPHADGYAAFPVPFAGEFGESPSVLEPRGYPLGGLFLLHHGAELAVRPVSAVTATAQILAASPFVNTDLARVGDVMDRIAALLAAAPVFELATAREDDFGTIRGRMEDSLNGI